MPDREKVIKAIETHLSTDISVGCDDCTYENDGWCTTRVLADALTLLKEQEHKDRMFQALEDDWKRLKELLKEQEAVAPVLVGRMWECGKCHAPVGIFMDDQRDQFCRTCGRPVKW